MFLSQGARIIDHNLKSKRVQTLTILDHTIGGNCRRSEKRDVQTMRSQLQASRDVEKTFARQAKVDGDRRAKLLEKQQKLLQKKLRE